VRYGRLAPRTIRAGANEVDTGKSDQGLFSSASMVQAPCQHSGR
jgi:hypothetical protein